MMTDNVAKQMTLWADRLREISARGAYFAGNKYDRENYETIREIAMGMMALANGDSMAEMEPLRTTIFAQPTPLAVGDGAVIDDNGRILLIRRADNGLWAMPGGGLEVGETPAAGVVREVFEETGMRVKALALSGVHDSRRCGTHTRHHLYHFVFLCRPAANGHTAVPSHANEVLAVEWFPADALPDPLAPDHAIRIREAFRLWQGEEGAYFDREERG
jgi:ADP-ribose pyrophosphatase YjhB (NUDIX family)